MGADIRGWIEVQKENSDNWHAVVKLGPLLTRQPDIQYEILEPDVKDVQLSYEVLSPYMEAYNEADEARNAALETVRVVRGETFAIRVEYYSNDIETDSWFLGRDMVRRLQQHFGKENVRLTWWTEYDPVP